MTLFKKLVIALSLHQYHSFYVYTVLLILDFWLVQKLTTGLKYMYFILWLNGSGYQFDGWQRQVEVILLFVKTLIWTKIFKKL